MKLIIAGGRNYKFTQHDLDFLDQMDEDENITEVVSGGALGADLCGEQWTKSHKLNVKKFFAYWHKYGSKAGPLRNKIMSEHADAVVLFPGGFGTESMNNCARQSGIKIYDRRK